MNKKFIVRKNEEIQEIIKKNKKIINKYFIIYFIENYLNYNRYSINAGICFSQLASLCSPPITTLG